MTYYQALLDALTAEALHKDNGQEDIVLPPKEHESVPGSVPISYLGACPRLKGLERRNYPKRFPELDWRNNASTILKIHDGSMTEEFVQRAMIRAGLATPESIEVSVRIDSQGIRLHGRLDAETNYTPEGEILEIKRSEKFYGKDPTPFMKYAFQVLSYGIARHKQQLYVLVVEHAGIHLYRLTRSGDGWMFVNELTGDPVDAPWNTPEFINVANLAHMARTMTAYIAMPDEEILATRPIEDPLNPPESYLYGETWQCAKVSLPKKKGASGSCAPSCTHSCHHEALAPFAVHREDNRVVRSEGGVVSTLDPNDVESLFEGL